MGRNGHSRSNTGWIGRTAYLASAIALMTAAGAVAQDMSQDQPVPEPYPTRIDGYQLVRVWIDQPSDMRIVDRLTDDIWSHHVGPDGAIDILVSPEQMTLLGQSRLPAVVLNDDVQALIDAEWARLHSPTRVGHDGGQSILGDDWYLDFKTYDEVMAYLDELAARNPDIATVVEIGTSIEGRLMKGIEIRGLNASANCEEVLFNGNQHAREWVTPMSSTYIAEQLIDGYGVDPDLTAIVDTYAITVVPISNPDGYSYTWTNYRLWRKNRRNNGDGSFGIDLNRNWEYEWGGVGSSGNPNSDLYRGTDPFSEPETQALRDYILDRPNMTMHIDIHSYGQLVLYPWCFSNQRIEDYETFRSMAVAISDAALAVHGKYYRPGQWYSDLYPSSGTMIDWCYGARSGMMTYNIELRDTGSYGFLLPPEQILPTAQELFAGLVTMMQTGYEARPMLDVSELVYGSQAQLRGGRMTPGMTAYFIYSLTGEGSTYVPQLDVTLSLAKPVLGGSATVGNDGIASLVKPLPGSGPPRIIWVQAAEQQRVSNLITTQINN
ncbi:MAG: hypothetical protein HND57_01190 [Planctomycetes bacterium]|nr:hypothetical protein [Planctomycetota bacterium]